MELNNFHFETPLWLWGLFFIPSIWMLSRFFTQKQMNFSRLETFIDKDLLPHLLINGGKGNISFWKILLAWSVLWALLISALAGPRWDYHDIETFTPDQSLCILLDVSQSMDAQDVKPSRIIRARQIIEDILNLAQGVKISLIVFAADPHMITPLTDDMDMIRNFLPSLGTDLVHVQGSRLSPAILMASRLLEISSGHNKSILVISDGGFEDENAIAQAHKLAQQGIRMYVMGIGTEEGSPIYDKQGNTLKMEGSTILSKLEKDKLRELSQAGKGQYLEAQYSDELIQRFLNQIKENSTSPEKTLQKVRQWEERFYLLVLPAMALLLFWFRRGFVFSFLLFIFFLSGQQTRASHFQDYFKNVDTLAKEALDQGNYEKALEIFKDPYRQGVAQYKAGNFAEAEKLFQESQRPEVATDALYNLGNALANQQKLEQAVRAYERVLEKNPDHIKAKHNLEIVKKLLEQEQKKEQEKKEDEKSKDSENPDQSDQNKENSKPEDQQKSKDQDAQKNDNSSEKNEPEKGNEEDKDQNDIPGIKSNEEKNQGDEQKSLASNGDDKKKPSGKKAEPEQEKRPFPQEGPIKTQEDIDADQWLDQMTNDQKSFLKNQFYMESQQNGSKEGIKPW
ncbi:MAG: VWA domain-containing protein [Alphaproteobacteria bacterium]|nr:VWA domain-containing protein [Alphaproteobacteria bacterium]